MTASTEFEALLVAGAVRVLRVAALWLVALAAAALVEQASGGRVRTLRGVGCPTAWRPAVLLAASAVLTALGAGGAGATTAPLPVPERPSDGPARVAGPGARPAPASDPVVVRPGDTLWSLVRERLPDRASDADVLALTVRTHAANRDVIGDDPDLLHPGQRLRLPQPLSQPLAQPLSPTPPGDRR